MLADLWKPATTREIAARARLETSKCSAQLTRLIERGVVQVMGGTARRKQYYLTERLYNIYYLLRRSRGQDSLIKALIQFMESYYSGTELRDIGAHIAREAGNFGGEMQSLARIALAQMMKLPALARTSRRTTCDDSRRFHGGFRAGFGTLQYGEKDVGRCGTVSPSGGPT